MKDTAKSTTPVAVIVLCCSTKFFGVDFTQRRRLRAAKAVLDDLAKIYKGVDIPLIVTGNAKKLDTGRAMNYLRKIDLRATRIYEHESIKTKDHGVRVKELLEKMEIPAASGHFLLVTDVPHMERAMESFACFNGTVRPHPAKWRGMEFPEMLSRHVYEGVRPLYTALFRGARSKHNLSR